MSRSFNPDRDVVLTDDRLQTADEPILQDEADETFEQLSDSLWANTEDF